MTEMAATRELVRLDARMRRARSGAGAVRAGVDFLVRAVELHAVHDLNHLAHTYAPASPLSERSLDLVFEQGDVTDEILAAIIAKAEACTRFNDALARAFSAASVAEWRQHVAEMDRQGVLL